jgi:hypothetical protein
MSALECPSPEQLDNFLRGRLDDPLLDTVADHVEDCTACQQILETINDRLTSVVELLRQTQPEDSHAEDPHAAESELQVALQAIRDLSNAPSHPLPAYGPKPDTADYSKAADETHHGRAIRDKSSDRVEDPTLTLPDRYEPIREIARGGMGAVWEVRDAEFDRPLAVKVMLSGVLRKKGQLRVFSARLSSRPDCNIPQFRRSSIAERNPTVCRSSA